MNETTTETIQRQVRVAFMLAVTATMLALTVHHARRGLPGAPTTVVYALTVGFGIEYLTATWSDRGGDRAQTSLNDR